MRVLEAILRGMTWFGIKVELFTTVREGETYVEIAQATEAYEFGFLTAIDVEDLTRLEPGTDREKLITWFREGKLCYGVRDNSRLIAKMWCDFTDFNHPTNLHKLAADEVYLFSAYVDPEYRGRGLAPLMRTAVYASMRAMGRSKFYSYSRYFNTAGRHFKSKLGAREESLIMHFRLFGKWSRSLTFRWGN